MIGKYDIESNEEGTRSFAQRRKENKIIRRKENLIISFAPLVFTLRLCAKLLP
jgi:hypothetical protein